MRIEEEVWIIMSTDRKWIAKGVPRSRYLVEMEDKKDKKRIITYCSEKKAINGYELSGFYLKTTEKTRNMNQKDIKLEAIKAKLIIET